MMSTARRIGPIGQIRRYREIVAVLVKYGFIDVVHTLHRTPYLAVGRRLLSAAGRQAGPDHTRPQRFRLALEELGPTFVKFGQALSTRADLLPADVVAELVLLQDSVPALPAGAAEQAIEASLGRPVDELFRDFTPAPLAAASIAQVHHATLRSGEEVVVKVRRPGIGALIESDLAILANLAALAEHHIADAQLYSLSELVAEFARSIRHEQDLAREGRIIARVAAQFDGDPTVYFPAIHWPLTTPAVLTMEFLRGVKVTALGTPAAPEANAKVVARRGADAVLKQILVNGLFHADPHPGNVLVLPGDVVAFIDFGIVGRVNRQMRERLADAVQAMWRHDPERLAEVVTAVATPQRPVDMAELARDLEEILDVYGNVAIGDLSLAHVFNAAAAAVSRHRLKFPADLLLLIKSLVTIEGVGRQLDPSFKMIEHAAPVVERLAEQEYSAAALALRVAQAGREAIDIAQALPRDLAEIARKVRSDRLRIQFVHTNLDHFVREMDRSRTGSASPS